MCPTNFVPGIQSFFLNLQNYFNIVMLGHVSIRVSDLEASTEFYLRALRPLGFVAMRFPTVVGLGPPVKSSSAPIPCFWLRQYTPAPSNSHVRPLLRYTYHSMPRIVPMWTNFTSSA
jgi:hypothetical protein